MFRTLLAPYREGVNTAASVPLLDDTERTLKPENLDAEPPEALPKWLALLAWALAYIEERLTASLQQGRPLVESKPQAQPKERLMGVHEAAHVLGVKPDWLYRHANELPFTRRIGRHLRFSSEAIQQYLDLQKRGGT